MLTLQFFVVDKTVPDLDPELGSLMWIQIRGSHSYADTDTDPQHENIHEVSDLLDPFWYPYWYTDKLPNLMDFKIFILKTFAFLKP